MRLFFVAAFVVCVFCAVAVSAAGGEQQGALDLGEVLVTTEKWPPAALDARDMVVITREEIESRPGKSLAEILDHAAGVDVRGRGPGGVQADVHVRGGGFDQAVILINGIRATDPQTGHHNMDIPVPLEDVERIEILRGNGTSLQGAGASSGVINIVTAPPRARRAAFGISSGKHSADNFYFGLSGGRASFSAESADSSGHRPGTDYGMSAMKAESVFSSGGARGRFTAGYVGKSFGADGFYAPWPSRERTRGSFFSMDLERENQAGGSMVLRLYGRRHSDRFDCSVLNPALCANFHRSVRSGVELSGKSELGGGRARYGMLLEENSIRGTGMNSSGGLTSFFAGYDFMPSEKFLLDAAVRRDSRGGYRPRTSWSVSAAYPPAPGFGISASYGRSFRTPTYTELSYSDPVHLSTSGLSPESSKSGEISFSFSSRLRSVSVSAFHREVRDLLDWTRPSKSSPWTIGNRGVVRFSGIEGILRRRFGSGLTVSLVREFHRVTVDQAIEYKYTGRLPARRSAAEAQWAPPGSPFSMSFSCRTAENAAGGKVYLFDAALRLRRGGIEYYIAGENLTGERYEDVAGAPMPRLTATAGVKWRTSLMPGGTRKSGAPG